MNPKSLADLLIKFWDYFIDHIIPLTFRYEGTAVVRKTAGKPTKVYPVERRAWQKNLILKAFVEDILWKIPFIQIFMERMCWKIPFVQSFDVVDIRKHAIHIDSHSFFFDKSKIIPFNLVLDTQIEFRIINPCVIYKIVEKENGNNWEPLYTHISNEAHLILSQVLKEMPSLESDQFYHHIQEAVDRHLASCRSKLNVHHKTAEMLMKTKAEEDILLEKIVVTGFDYTVDGKWAK